MSNRWLRFGIALLALGAAAAASYRIFQQEQRLNASLLAAQRSDLAAESTLIAIPEIKAALHAYVAEGQGQAFWTARAAMLLERFRASLLELDGPAAAAGASLTEALELAERLGASERRARDHVRAEQKLLAGEVIFTDVRDLLDGLRLHLIRVRSQMAEASAGTQAEIRREQRVLALGALGVLAFATLLLVIPAAAHATSAAVVPRSPNGDPPDEFESSARIISRTPINQGPSTPSAKGARNGGASASASNGAAATSATADKAAGARPASAARVAPAATAVPPPPAGPSLREAAAICTELGRASQSVEVSHLLARAAKVLDASGAVVWMASADGRELYPAASAGYDERLLSRIGSIPRTANNVTAGAIRSGTARASARVGQSAAALAVPLLTPLGAVGVLSAELKDVAEVDEARLAVATIFAAQLASLVGSRPSAAATPSAPAPQDAREAR